MRSASCGGVLKDMRSSVAKFSLVFASRVRRVQPFGQSRRAAKIAIRGSLLDTQATREKNLCVNVGDQATNLWLCKHLMSFEEACLSAKLFQTISENDFWHGGKMLAAPPLKLLGIYWRKENLSHSSA